MKEVKNILLVGVGGQGTILASRILSEALAEAGYDLKMSEVHGMSQRGGGVSTQIRYGERVYSPIIGTGEADTVVAFEKMEALRQIEYLKPNGTIVLNDYEIPSAPILMGKEAYPAGIVEALREKADVVVLDAKALALRAGSVKAMNIVLLGALVKTMDIRDIDWAGMIRKHVKKGFEDVNIKAFYAGHMCGN